jgi:hypothetical protein
VWARLLAVTGLTALLVLVALPLAGRAALVESTSWIDAPLDGSVLAVTPYRVVAHSADQAGVAQVVLAVDGVDVQTFDTTTAGRLVTSRFAWTPTGPGDFVLTVRARSTAGAWGAPATATVFVAATASGAPQSALPQPSSTAEPAPSGSPAAGPTAGSTPTPGPTASLPRPTSSPTPGQTTRVTLPPTSTPTPSPTPCTPNAPTLTAPADFYLVNSANNPPTFQWAYSGSCPPTGFHVVVNDADGATITSGIVGAAARSWSPAPFTIGRSCVVYYWTAWSRGAGGTDITAAPRRQLAVCP